MAQFFISTFYKFTPIANPDDFKIFLENLALRTDTIGLIIIGTEGFNATVASTSTAGLNQFRNEILKKLEIPDLMFKDSQSQKPPFRRFKVKIREEIVTLGTPELVPNTDKNHHLTPTEWNHVLKNEKDVVVIDTRNWYETKIGTFKTAINPMTDQFTEFPQFMDQNNLDKEKKVLIFCTGGIRCERGILELQRKGFKDVYQLEGGILNYLKEYPNDQFEGECFVFDHRVAVDQSLQPTIKYHLCPHCGQPAEIPVDCKRCDTHAFICDDCEKLEWKNVTCSKNCAYQLELHPDRKGAHQPLSYK
ncbi:MAG: hypothetical protein A2622_12480 [Bdellovibrionales bacterium RIFCSPHIGHO2_01_FULL_40_29]|nr:MAG: hypothetical protein A2622_12480 [Bdellovibrionales bacterium RIFCSPHIGHO2_01_FULL_40_29]OFZ33000.1 MAG: hypothetical protein A3D17_09790 [Bdellovibrionales bacterium RIFCSPHIGHO2_02_FULL_40_15]